MAAFEETESVLLRDLWPNRGLRGDADVLAPTDEESWGLPPGLFLPPNACCMLRILPPSASSLALGLRRRPPSMSIFFIMVLWLASELIVLLVNVGMVVDLDCEYLRPPNPGPGALMGV